MADEGRFAGVPAHYGNPVAEQRKLEQGAIVDLSALRVFGITGADRISWLDSMLSQSLIGAVPGQSFESLLLDPQGRVEHQLKLYIDTEQVLLIEAFAGNDALPEWLGRMIFMKDVQITQREELRVIGHFGSEKLHEDALVWHDPWAGLVEGGYQYAQFEAGEHPGDSWNWTEQILPVSAYQELLSKASSGGVKVAGTLAFDALRIAAFRPAQGAETIERLIPHEVDWMRSAVHLTKGCYRGQETVAKVHNLGHPPRRLVLLQLDGTRSIYPKPGDEVLLGEKSIGVVTSFGNHQDYGPIALAIVKRNVDVDAELLVQTEYGLVDAAQEVIVPPSAGSTAEIPKLPRL